MGFELLPIFPACEMFGPWQGVLFVAKSVYMDKFGIMILIFLRFPK